ncbi:DUF3800 domain-containing protein [Chitinophaga sp. NPDC101104]|uniref:DUF3800 domain-containing protein n=1 Tax=Chitinophaga sp. NPDC101104 TaxID=3390561 RepID=UPI003D06372A
METAGVKLRKKFYFIDETGDPNFYDKRGLPLEHSKDYQPYFILGMVETFDRKALRDVVMQFTSRMKSDVLYNSIPSIADNKDWFVHARQDHPEVRINFIELMRSLTGIDAHVSVIRKELNAFREKHDNKRSSFYIDCLRRLLMNKQFEKDIEHCIYLSQYGSFQAPFFEEALAPLRAGGIQIKLSVVNSRLMPELSIVDYLLWMVQRKLLKGESRFFNALRDKFKVIEGI